MFQHIKTFKNTKTTAVFAVAIVIGVVVIATVVLLKEKPYRNYVVVNVGDVPDENYFLYQDRNQSYLVFKNRKHGARGLESPTRKNKNVVDPTFEREPNSVYGVLAVEMLYGYMLLPAYQWWDYSIPCLKLEFSLDDFTHDHQVIPGGLRCKSSLSAWWQHNLVYDLQGKSVSAYVADLYIPKFYVVEDEIRIGIEDPK
ncbi:MAG: hypothetical protein AB8B86_16170 [Pseudomonadales bacterium]